MYSRYVCPILGLRDEKLDLTLGEGEWRDGEKVASSPLLATSQRSSRVTVSPFCFSVAHGAKGDSTEVPPPKAEIFLGKILKIFDIEKKIFWELNFFRTLCRSKADVEIDFQMINTGLGEGEGLG